MTKINNRLENVKILEGIVVKTSKNIFEVRIGEETITAAISKKINKSLIYAKSKNVRQGAKGTKQKKYENSITIGDIVLVELKDDGSYLIKEIKERKNKFIRQDVVSSYKKNVKVSNIDEMLIVLSLTKPETKFGFIDRLIVGCKISNIKPILLFNKLDEATEEDIEKFRFYEKIGFKIFYISAKTGENIKELKSEIRDKRVMFLGLSGVGKSTILNNIFEDDIAKTGDISDYNDKGKHTTTDYQCYFLDNNTGIIDSPGIKQFQFFEIERKKLQDYFEEFIENRSKCKFKDCIHIHEKGCYIKELVEKDEIKKSRYESYLRIFETLPENLYNY